MTATIVPQRIEHLPLDELAPYARNSRTHSPEQIAQVAASIREFGFTNPVLIDAQGGIIAGHGRVMAARQLGLAEVPCIRLPHLTDAQKRAYIIADNKLALNAGWDDELLALELRDLDALGFDLDLTGFADDEISKLLDLELGEGEGEGQGDADAVPEVRPDPISKPGDVWVLGRHRLMCGDSCAPETYVALLQGQHGDLVFTDPPYGVDFSSRMEAQHQAAKKNPRHKRTAHANGIPNDALSDNAQKEFWLAAFTQIAANIKAGAPYYLCSPQGGRMMMMMMSEAGIPQRHEIIWRKNMHVLGRADYHYIHEPILYGWKEGAGHAWYGDRSQMSVWEVARPQKSELHPTMKPVELIEIALKNSSKAGDIVLDAFGGSGSTLIACERLGRSCRMVEISENYCDVIVRRWQDFTGQRATHAETGDPFPEAPRA